MPVVFMSLGTLMMLAAVLGEPKQLERLLATDLAPGSNLFAWTGALGGVAAIGFIPQLQGLSRAFLLLTIISVTVREGTQITELLREGPKIPTRTPAAKEAVPPRGQQTPPTMQRGPAWIDPGKTIPDNVG
jgi:hypothetical protein